MKGLASRSVGTKTIRSFFVSAVSVSSASQPTSESFDDDDKLSSIVTLDNPIPQQLVRDDRMHGGSSFKRSRQSDDSTAPVSTVSLLTTEADADAFSWRPFEQLEAGWRVELSAETSKPYFRSLLGFLDGELRAGRTIYPPAADVFTAFNLCPLDQVKVSVPQ